LLVGVVLPDKLVLVPAFAVGFDGELAVTPEVVGDDRVAVEAQGRVISGRSMPARSRRLSRRFSSVLRVGAGPSAMTARSAPVPGWPLERSTTASSRRTLT
jgi:hypothetical protein